VLKNFSISELELNLFCFFLGFWAMIRHKNAYKEYKFDILVHHLIKVDEDGSVDHSYFNSVHGL
jgi:hypothetical protein